ncbi:uncharacterized protein [Miscanthus floridulus]|uniref:uncharacterized protein n=1 Tax=Miscanthus floridulus TaxID=154761 RepID=UPI003458A741
MGTSAGVPDQHSRKDGEARDPHAVAQMHLGDGLAVHWARLITRSRSGAATRYLIWGFDVIMLSMRTVRTQMLSVPSVAGSDDCLLLLCYGVWNRRCCTAIPFITLKKKDLSLCCRH